jgi:hypothetical protein
MVSKPYKRRDVLKNTGVAAVLAGSVPVFSQGSKAAKNYEGSIAETSSPFFEFSISVSEDVDAPKVTACSQFPSFIPGEERICLTDTVFDPQKAEKSFALIATQEGFEKISSRGKIEYSWLPISGAPIGRGTFIQKGKIHTDILVQSFGSVVNITVGDSELQATPETKDSLTRKCEVEFQDADGETHKGSQEMSVHLRNYGVSKVLSHEELVLIPKESQQGLQLKKMIAEGDNRDLGGWNRIYDLGTKDVWGIELKNSEGPQ